MGCSCGSSDPSPGLRRVTEMASEPLLAVYEDEIPAVFGCGTTDCDPLVSSHPTALRIERFKAGVLVQGAEFDLPESLKSAYAKGNCAKGTACLPWVKYARDPKTFLEGLARARAVGKIDSAKKIHSIFLGSKDHPGPAITEDQEVFYVLMLDTQLQACAIGEISRGARDRVQTPIPDILRLPVTEGAITFVVVHNHPSDNVTPSQADKEVTKAIAQAGESIGIPLFDHVIVGPTKYYSFFEHRLL